MAKFCRHCDLKYKNYAYKCVTCGTVLEKKKKTPEKADKSGKTAYNFDTSTKKKKENPTKSNIIALLATILAENGDFSAENVEITNKERQIAFTVGENAFELTLVQKRKPK